jgi:hypothetical protein
VHEDHGAGYERERVDGEPGGVPLGHEGADVRQLPDRLDQRRCEREQLLVQLEARAALAPRAQSSRGDQQQRPLAGG